MTPLTEIAAWKLLLLALAALAAAAFLVWFACYFALELLRDLRVRRSGSGSIVASDYHVRPEWAIKDSPAWGRWQSDRNNPLRQCRVAAHLRRLGQ